ncbi:MAG: hypothetical protein ACK56I_37455, partial [bacterium]
HPLPQHDERARRGHRRHRSRARKHHRCRNRNRCAEVSVHLSRIVQRHTQGTHQRLRRAGQRRCLTHPSPSRAC